MRGRYVLGFLLAVACPVSTGCRGPSCWSPGPPPAPDLPAVERRLTPPDVSRVSDAPPGPTPLTSPEQYHRLTADECAALACANAAVANLIVTAAADDPSGPHLSERGRAAATARVRRIVAVHSSQEARVRTCAAALDLYYRLLEAELLTDVLAESQTQVDALVAAGEAVEKAGGREPAEFLRLRKQQVELRTDRTRLQLGITRLNTELKAVLKLDQTPGRLLPADQIQVVPDPLDPAQAVQVGLATRPDLRLTRDLVAALDNRTVEVIRAVAAELAPPVRAINAAAAVFAPGLKNLIPLLTSADVEPVRRQLLVLLADRERDAAKDIRAAVDEWAGQRELVVIARRRVEVEAGRIQDLRVRQKSGAAVEADLRRAVLDKLTADADLIREAVKWKQVDVKARQAMGLLCGGTGGCP